MNYKEEFKLEFPIETKSGVIESLTLRRPKARDLHLVEQAHKGGIGQSIELLANLTMQTPMDIEELDGKDFMRLQARVNDFLGIKG